MTISLTHIALHVENIKACSEFYQHYCGMKVIHRRQSEQQTILWLAEPGQEQDMILVMMDGGTPQHQAENDYSHFGFALESHAAVDAIAEKARQEGILLWPPKQEPYPVGYYCGVLDPNGQAVEFSYGQPLGPGAQPLETCAL